MAQPTIKKKQVTLKKTIKRKAAPSVKKAAPQAADAAADGDEPAAVAPGSKSAKAKPAGKGKKKAKASKEPKEAKAPSYTVFAILALLAAFLYIGLITIQSMELSFLSPAFPKAVEMGGM